MAKATSKLRFIGASVASVSIAGSLLLPAFALAETGSTTSPVAASPKGFCANVAEFQTTVSGKLTERLTKLETNKTDRLKQISDNRTKRDLELSQDRGQWDKNRTDRYAKLLEKATTTEEQAAVATFKTTIENAVTARRVAIDTAVKAYRDGVDAAVGSRQGAITTAAATLKTSIDTALATAASDCGAGKDQKVVRTKTMTAIKNAQTAFTTSVKSLDKSDSNLQALAKTRNDAVKKAITDFEAAKKAAEKALRAAWKA